MTPKQVDAVRRHIGELEHVGRYIERMVIERPGEWETWKIKKAANTRQINDLRAKLKRDEPG